VTRSAATIKALVARELEAVPDEESRRRLERLLVEPSFQHLTWEYGALGATRPCCIVAKSPDEDLALVYSEDAFGPADPWGAVSLSEASMGDDSQWYGSLYDAAIGAGLCSAPPGYEGS
jgi:hypothetical protein